MFSGENYNFGAKYKRCQVQVAVVGDRVEISVRKHLIPSHPIWEKPMVGQKPHNSPPVPRGRQSVPNT